MFADLGHGLLLFGLGMLLRQRGNGSITTWGTLIAASGAAAAIAGLGTGEVFGFHILGIAVLAPITSHIPFIGVLNISELTFAQVVKILKVSVAIGIVHLLMAFFLRLHKDVKDGNKLFVWTHDIPNIIQFLAIVSLGTSELSVLNTISLECLELQVTLIQNLFPGCPSHLVDGLRWTLWRRQLFL